MQLLKIRSVAHLRRVLERLGDERGDFYIFLKGGLRSGKNMAIQEGKFCINNEIDDSHQDLTEDELFTDSNIGEAITKGAFFYVDLGERG